MSAGLIMVQQYQKMVIQRFGTYTGTKSSGLHFLIPFVYHGTKVDLRERVARVPTQKYITADNVVVDMDFVIYYRVMENMADRAVLEVQNFELAVINLAFATLRAVIGATTLADALAERERIRDGLQVRMDEVTERWGVKVAPGRVGSATKWGDGDLEYAVEVRGNSFYRTGGDDGEVAGAFFGAAHEAMGGVLERSDLTAGFGGTR